MVIERIRVGNVDLVGARFREKGRMLPDDVVYRDSWLEPSGARCFQLMEAPGPERLDVWIRRWHDLVDFEVIPVQTSAEFWAQRSQERRSP